MESLSNPHRTSGEHLPHIANDGLGSPTLGLIYPHAKHTTCTPLPRFGVPVCALYLVLRDLVYRMATSLEWRLSEDWLEEGLPARLLANCSSIQQIDYSLKAAGALSERPWDFRPTLDVTPLASLGHQLRQLNPKP